MAKQSKDKWESEHLRNMARYARQIDEIYRSAVREAAIIGVDSPNFDPDKPFSFDAYPSTKRRIEKLLNGLKSQVQMVVLNGIDVEWTLANNKNNELANVVFGKNAKRLTDEQSRRYYRKNDEARRAFAERTISGLNLSDRVWKYTDQFKSEIEMGIDVGLRDGLSADQMSRQLRQYLQQPDKLFRRVRDEHGVLHLSKQAEAYHPGQGVYRSSYKNARRLAATETNIAYRTSDYLRWQQFDFVVGIEIKLSNNHTIKNSKGEPVPFEDICDTLAGKYPKDFKFTGWHPQCRCYAVSIMKTDEEIAEDTRKILNGEPLDGDSVNRVDDVPQAFKDWVSDNSERIEAARRRGTLPYFIRDNNELVNDLLDTPQHEPTALEVAAARHAARTPEQVAAIKKAWNERKQNIELATIEEDFKFKGVAYNAAAEFSVVPQTDEVISRLGGGDLTDGSCSSAAFAFAANRAGLDVLDFRGGSSCDWFSRNSNIQKVVKMFGGTVVEDYNGYTNAKNLLKTVEEGKEYYFTSGRHAAIVRRAEGGTFEYLELQTSNSNGFKPLTIETLGSRFRTQKSRTLYGMKIKFRDSIIDIDLLKNERFRKLVGYINTSSSSQKKGVRGGAK